MKKNFYTFVFCMLFGFAAGAQTIVQLSFYSPLISTFDGKYTNDHLVIAQNGVLIFNVSNPFVRPKLVGQTTYPGSFAYDVAVQGNYAYMAEGGSGIFAVYNIADFNNPVLAGSVAIPATEFYPGDLEPHGNYAYMSGFDSLYVIDISNSSAPKVAKTVPLPHTDFTGAEDIEIDHNTLFVKTPLEVRAYNIINPVNPLFISTVPYKHTSQKGMSVDSINHRLFLPWTSPLQEFLGHETFDVSNPAAPQFLFADSIAFGTGEYGISAYSPLDNVLYISRGGGVTAFDVAPATHHFVTEFSGQDVPNSTVAIAVKDSVFFNIRGGGFEVLQYVASNQTACDPPLRRDSRVSGTSVLFRWDKVDNALGYAVRYKKAGAGGQWKRDTTRNNTLQVNGLSPDTRYLWQVATVCGVRPLNPSEWSDAREFTTGAQAIESLISYAPNPVRDVLRIQIKSADVAQIVITDLSGNRVTQINAVKSEQLIPMTHLRTGTYLLQMLNDQRQVIGSAKVFKQ